MPPVKKSERRDMIDAVISMIEESGFESVSARTLARRLDISTQPIYREFGDMAGVKKAALERGFEIFCQYTAGEALDQAENYVRFAVERSNLFNFLFRNKQYEYKDLDDLKHKLIPATDILERLSAITGLAGDDVYTLHLYIWMALHGLASMAADNRLPLKSEEIREFTKAVTVGMTEHIRESEKRGENERA